MNEDNSKKKEQKKNELTDIPTSSKEKKETKSNLKAKPKKNKYPIILVGKNHIVYRTKKGNVWVHMKASEVSNYKVSGEYEV